jgi:hypothetical protein
MQIIINLIINFFQNVNWSTVRIQKPVFVPQLDDWKDTSYFDGTFLFSVSPFTSFFLLHCFFLICLLFLYSLFIFFFLFFFFLYCLFSFFFLRYHCGSFTDLITLQQEKNFGQSGHQWMITQITTMTTKMKISMISGL